MVYVIRTIRLNKGFGSRFFAGFRFRYESTEEGRVVSADMLGE